MSKKLHLTLKKKWFDMIASGEKKEEYRDIKDYWTNRLCCGFPSAYDTKDFDQVQFRNGYAKYSPTITLQCKGIFIKEGNPKWGAVEGQKYFVIELGNIISTSHE
ncbi:hypothetical protein ACF3OC_08510 [Sphingobacterium cellulitidis]|uniref:hypothetical protein n=1 Tax=Sphingobacterium cellulitidis TaxID=1768011 RepID=UPI000B93D968|nr:hypothetical protein CHT99_10415 [Sphingobacterium cellulitidis]